MKAAMQLLMRPLWTPEGDEKRFLAGLTPAIFLLILPAWKHGLLDVPGGNPVLLVFVLWWLTYLLRFHRRLQSRGELKRVIIVPAVFIGLLTSIRLL